MRRVVSIWLPDWPISVWQRRNAPRHDPFALVERGPHGMLLHAVNPAARALGLRQGQPHADALAMRPGLATAPADPPAEAVALHRLALWLQRWSPFTAADPAAAGLEGLWLESTGADHLFGGEAALLADIRRRLAAMGVPARLGLAGTMGAAWALARFASPKNRIAASGEEAAALAPLPLAALRLNAEALRLLRRFGLRRIGELAPLPRAGLARRFKDLAVLPRLDQALGRLPEPLQPLAPPVPQRADRVFAEPITALPVVEVATAELADRLGAALAGAELGARRLRLTGWRVDGALPQIEVALGTPSCRPAHLLRLLRDRGFERLDLGFGIDALRLEAVLTEPLRATQPDALDPAATDDDAFAALLDRLAARLGEAAVRQPVQVASWIPECSERLRPATVASTPELAATPVAERPLLLLDPPEPIDVVAEVPDSPPRRFTWRRVARQVARASGPERLAPEWWRQAAGRTRDYFHLEATSGGRYWVFREGLYEEEAAGQPTRWWMHGVFG